ncbi:HD-GYP domain-containing protein [Castellaniella sp. WN]
MSIERIPPSELRLGMYIHKLEGDWFRHPFWRGSFLLIRPQELEAIQAAGIRKVWIDTARGRGPEDPAARESGSRSAAARHEAMSDPVSAEASGPRVSLEEEIEQARRLCLAAHDQVLGMFDEARMGRAIDPEATLPLVRQIADSVARHPQALFSVARLKTSDNYTYLHSVAVCALMLALSRQLRLDAELTWQAGLGGLMHDLGKAAVPLEILNKPGRLSDAEFDVMKRHPVLGAAMLREGGADESVQSVALHHHEKFDGSGYPDGLSGSGIPLLARMGAVCDVYDAVTSERVYKAPWNPAETMRRMAAWAGHFDRPVFEAFVKTVGIYPIGSLVRLKSRRLAVVVASNPDSLLLPRVKAFFCLETRRVCPEECLDLSDPGCGDRILRPEDPSAWNFTGLETYWMPGESLP